ncbi:MAG: hypothetical protein M0Q43_14585 [Methanothrix sp.]|jgi:hypothetical protein|nr:hypothetical protein [Methanothrix sp.]
MSWQKEESVFDEGRSGGGRIIELYHERRADTEVRPHKILMNLGRRPEPLYA